MGGGSYIFVSEPGPPDPESWVQAWCLCCFHVLHFAFVDQLDFAPAPHHKTKPTSEPGPLDPNSELAPSVSA